MSHKPLAIRTTSLKRGAFAIPVVLSVVISASSTQAQIPCEYEVTIIQAPKCPPFGFPPTIGRGISEPIDGGLPNVVGYYQSCTIGPETAFLWIGNENKFIMLDMPEGTQRSWAFGISADGTQIVGTAEIGGVGSRAFLIDGDDLIVIPPANGGTFSNAQAVSLGRVAGTTSVSDRPPFYSKAYLWQEGRMTIIEPTYGSKSAGRDVSESGTVVGWMGTGTNSDSHTLLWQDGKIKDLGVIPGGFTSEPRGINRFQQIVGRGKIERDGQTLIRAFLWEDDQFLDLGTLPGFDRCAAIDINNSTTIIGGCDQSDNPNNDVPFLWQDCVMMNLQEMIAPDLGLDIADVGAINNAGQITGRANINGHSVAFLLTPVPSPIGDLDRDCQVGASDLLILLSNWGPCENCSNCPADLNGNCVVGASDLLILLVNWSS